MSLHIRHPPYHGEPNFKPISQVVTTCVTLLYLPILATAVATEPACFGSSRHALPRLASRSRALRSVNELARSVGSSSSSHVIGIDTGAPGLGRSEYAATNVAPSALR